MPDRPATNGRRIVKVRSNAAPGVMESIDALAFMVDPQEGLPYSRMRDLAQMAEAAGFESFVRSDHWLSLKGDWSAHATDAWTTLAALARDTTRIRLGTMVSRSPSGCRSRSRRRSRRSTR